MKDIPIHAESTGISIFDTLGETTDIINIYRKPNTQINRNEWRKFLQQFNNSKTILTGDLNIHSRNWNCQISDKNAAIIQEEMWERNMYVVNVDTLSYLGDYDHIPSNIDLIMSTADMINDIKYEQIKDT